MSNDNLNRLSDEEILRLELLADGELDEDARRELLLRLDQTSDGWRRCACAFLENQCYREAFRSAPAAEPAGSGSPQIGRNSLWKQVGPAGRFSSVSARHSSLRAESASAFESAEMQVPPPMLIAGKAKREPEAAFSPLPHSGTPSAQTRSFWKPAFISAVCLLIASLALVEYRHQAARREFEKTHYTGVLQDLYAPGGTAEDVDAADIAEAPEVAETEPAPASEEAEEAAAPLVAAVSSVPAEPAAGSLPAGGMFPAPRSGARMNASVHSAGGVPVAAKSLGSLAPAGRPAEKVRHITIRRPGGLDEISVPCVEAESYVSDNSAAEALANNYREAGCQVETLHEELKFQLKDGKTVIVPVDTIDVQHAPPVTHFL